MELPSGVFVLMGGLQPIDADGSVIVALSTWNRNVVDLSRLTVLVRSDRLTHGCSCALGTVSGHSSPLFEHELAPVGFATATAVQQSRQPRHSHVRLAHTLELAPFESVRLSVGTTLRATRC